MGSLRSWAKDSAMLHQTLQIPPVQDFNDTASDLVIGCVVWSGSLFIRQSHAREGLD